MSNEKSVSMDRELGCRKYIWKWKYIKNYSLQIKTNESTSEKKLNTRLEGQFFFCAKNGIFFWNSQKCVEFSELGDEKGILHAFAWWWWRVYARHSHTEWLREFITQENENVHFLFLISWWFHWLNVAAPTHLKPEWTHKSQHNRERLHYISIMEKLCKTIGVFSITTSIASEWKILFAPLHIFLSNSLRPY